MKKAFSIIVLFFLIFQSSFATTYSSDPQTFVQEMVNDAIQNVQSFGHYRYRDRCITNYCPLIRSDGTFVPLFASARESVPCTQNPTAASGKSVISLSRKADSGLRSLTTEACLITNLRRSVRNASLRKR